ncbi:MAG: type II toxin-antitoxin system RelE/ParE family toxin [Clostridia bacterium]|nr:type II toxin-antitoxin system RelE/ParE family toxin [Clostridia bacterium]
MRWTVFYSAKAKQDLQSIYEYIAFDLWSPDTAEAQIKRIDEMIQSLDAFPFRHPVNDTEPLKSKGFRSVAVGNYVIIYLPQEKDCTVTIYRIIYGGRDLTNQGIE